MTDNGGIKIWMDFAKQYRRTAGFARGWVGTGLMLAAMGSTTLKTQMAKRGYDRLRPYQIDPSIRTIGEAAEGRELPVRSYEFGLCRSNCAGQPLAVARSGVWLVGAAGGT